MIIQKQMVLQGTSYKINIEKADQDNLYLLLCLFASSNNLFLF